jgi:hypothetical protein
MAKKALTIWQPWASLIVGGAKPFEFRRNRPPRAIVGQRIVIHAGKHTVDRDEVEDMLGLLELYPDAEETKELCLIPDKAIPVLEAFLRGELPMAAGIGAAIVGEPRFGTDIAAEFGVPRANDSDRDQHANWGWPMLDIEAWPAPVPARGMQGLWPWPEAASFAEAL